MLTRLKLYTTLVSFAVLASCGGTAERKPAKENITVEQEQVEVVNYDSLLVVMDARYNALCEERRVALDERDTMHRRALLEANDRACAEFQDSLTWLLQMKR
jgi:hypothetical protein